MNTKKDFEATARIIRAAMERPHIFSDKSEMCEIYINAQRDTFAYLAGAYGAENPRFDRARFLKACGLEGV